jgi:Leucine-rich repeat (LRR) protein
MEFKSLAQALEHTTPSQVTTLSLANQNLSSLPVEIGKFTNLKVLDLENNNLYELPEEIGLLKNLTTLDLSNNHLAMLPFSMRNLTSLMKFSFSRNNIEILPDIFEKMTNLRGIYAKRNKLNALPESLKHSIIQVIDVRQNGFVHAPPIIFQIPSLKNIRGILSDAQTSPSEIILSFNKAFEKTGLDTGRYREAFGILTDTIDSENVELRSLLEILQVNFLSLRVRVSQEILTRSCNASLEKGCLVSVLGTTNMPKQEIKEKLKENGIGYDTKITDKTTHLIVGASPKNVGEPKSGKSYTIWSEKELNDFFNTIEKPFLLEITDEADSQIEQLSRLLTSADSANIELGVQIIKGGGMPENLLEELFYAYKVCNDKKVKIELKKVIQINASASVLDALNKRDMLFNADSIINVSRWQSSTMEKDIFKAIKKYSSFSNEISWGKIASFIYDNYGYGGRYIFAQEKEGSLLRKHILDKSIVNNILNFNTIFIKGIPDYNTSFIYPYITPYPFPKEILDYTTLQNLDISGCQILSLPEEFDKLSSLKNLNLSHNFLSKLPLSFEKLQQLEVLDLSGNEFTTFPKEIMNLKNLKQCTFQNNRSQWNENKISISKEVKDALPNCEFID